MSHEENKCAEGESKKPHEDGGAPGNSSAPKWRSRDYLPHCEHPQLIQGITFRLIDSMPQIVLDRWVAELVHLPDAERDTVRRSRIEAYLDSGHGECWLRDPRIARLMQEALLHFDGERYQIVAWCVMPNHVHVIARIHAGHSLGEVIYSWKSWVAKQANKLLGRSGAFWQREYYDRYMRDEKHLADAILYVEMNPVKPGLVKTPEAWPWSSARLRKEGKMKMMGGAAGSAAVLVRPLIPSTESEHLSKFSHSGTAYPARHIPSRWPSSLRKNWSEICRRRMY